MKWWIGLVVLVSVAAGPLRADTWDVEKMTTAETIDLRTEREGEGEHWFPVWIVVVDGQPYVRLGSRAAERFQHHRSFPVISVRLEGQRIDQIRGEAAPERADAVDAAMADKYWSDIFVRWFPHPMTLRLVRLAPDAAAPTAP